MRAKLLSSILVSASMMTAAPLAAAPAASAGKLSVVNARAGAPMSDESKLAEGGGGILALAIVAGIAAIVIVGELAGDSDDSPVSS